MEDAADEPSRRRPEVEELFRRAAAPLPARVRAEAHGAAERLARLTQARAAAAMVSARPAAGTPLALAPGRVVAGRFRLARELGRGGVATVYLAHDERLGAEVALKTAAAGGEAYSELRARFEREARLSYRLGQTQGIVRTIDWGELEPGRALYLAMDLVRDARPLDLTAGPLQARLAALATAAGLVAQVHRHQIVHRDIKPQNFLVGAGGRVHLSDFGAARPVDEAEADDLHLTRTGVIIGTPLFMAPEQFSDPRHVDGRADVYALGVMLYLSLTGRFPYDGATAAEVLTRQVLVRHGVAAPPPGPRELAPNVDPELDHLCLEALRLDPDERLATADLFAQALRGRRPAAPSGRTPAPPPGPPLRERLGLDADGFAGREALRALALSHGPSKFEAVLAGVPALVAVDERPVQGVRIYQGKVAPLLARGGGRSARITLGRTLETDIAVQLPTVSKHHLTFVEKDGRWSVIDEGTVNGTTVDGTPVRPGEARQLRDRDVVGIARPHLLLRFVAPGSVVRHLVADDA